MQEIVCILDKSGSMQSVATDAVGGLNSFIKDQQAVPIPANLTIVWFDNTHQIGYEGDIQKVPSVTHWPSGGMTALNDAIGNTIKYVGERFSKENPEKVILAILTDGQENYSKEFSYEQVKSLIEEYKTKYAWEVIFLAADQDACVAGALLGVDASKTFAYKSKNTRGGFAIYSNAVIGSRLG